MPIIATRKWYIIVAIDYLIKWIEARPITAKEADKITQFLFEEIIIQYRVPKEILSNNRLEFANKTIKKFCF